MELKNLRVTVTGGAGYIGSVIVPLLLEKGALVTVVDGLIYGQDLPPWHQQVNFIKGDLRDQKILRRGLVDAQAIVHLAAIVGEPACRKNPELASDINIYVTKNLNQLRGNIPLIFFSSTSVYGEVGGAICDETTLPTPNPRTPYSRQKFKAERFIKPTDNWLIFRPATAFGFAPRPRLDLLANELTFRAVKDKKIELFNPDFNRTFIHVRDLAQGVIWGLENFQRLKNNIFNIGADELNITKRRIAEIIAKKIDFELAIVNGDADPDKRNFIIKYDKIKTAGFTPEISLEQGINEMIEKFNALPAGDEYYNTSQELTRDFRDRWRTASYKIKHMLLAPRNTAYQLLRRSEKFFKTDMIYLAKGGFWLNAGQVISATAAFLLSLAFANLLTPETYGTYKYVLSVVGILSIATLPGINTAIGRAAARDFDGSLLPGLRAKIKWGSLGGIAALAIAGFYWFNHNNELALAFLIAAVFLPIMESLASYDAFLQGKKQFKKSSQYSAIAQTAAMIVLVIAIFMSKNLLVILLSYFATWTALRAIFLWTTLKKNKKNQAEDPEMVKYGKRLTLIGVVSTIADYSDRLLLFHFVGAAEVAFYTVATAPLDQIKGVIGNIAAVAFPKFAAKPWAEINKTFWQKMLIFAGLIAAMTLVYILIAPWLYPIFFPKYINSIIYSQIYALSLVSLILIVPLYLMQAHKMEKEYYSFSLIYPVPHLILMAILTYYYGIMGLIISRVINRYFDLFLAIYLIRKRDK